jgi:hypothetical protein
MTATLTKLDLSSLEDDGDTLDLADGRTLRLKIGVDTDASINDSDCWGKVYDGPALRRNDMGYYPRPDGFTGNAERLWYGNDGPWWWEPPADIKRGTPAFDEMRQQVRELLAWGFKVVTLELPSTCDRCGRSQVVESASLWGIDSLDNGYIHEVVSELADELIAGIPNILEAI